MHKKLVHFWDKLRFLWYFLNYFMAAAVAPLFRNREEYRHLWLISERGTDAQDNGLYFYRYLRREHPEVNACYLLSEDSPDRRFFSEDDRLVRYRSFSHYLALVLAEYKVSYYGLCTGYVVFHQAGPFFQDEGQEGLFTAWNH